MSFALAFIAAWLALQAPVAAPQSLSVNLSVQAALAGGERTVYSVTVPPNHAARIVVQQQGIDVLMRFARHGEAIGGPAIDFVAGTSGEERLYLPILSASATWDVRIAAALPRATAAGYSVVVESAPADDATRATAAAHATYFQALEATFSVADGVALRKGLELFSASALAANAIGDGALEAEATFQSGRMHDQLGDTPGSIAWQLKAVEMFRKLGDPGRQSRVLNRLGDLSRKGGTVSDAERYFQEALPLAHAANDPVSVADILNNSGLLLLATGRAEEAITQLESALPLARAVNSNNVEGALLNNIAESYRRLGMFDKAVETSEQALPVIERLNVARRTARTLFNLAGSYFENGDTAKADAAIKRSLEVYQKAEDQAGYADSLGLYGRMSYAAGDADSALKAFTEARPILQAAKNRFAEATILAEWAEIEIDRGDFVSAHEKLDVAIELSRAIANPYTETRADYLRAIAFRNENRLDAAVEAIARTIDKTEAMRGTIGRVDLRTSYLASIRSYYDLYVDLLQQRGDVAGAFEVSERSRARALLEGLAESAAKIQKGADAGLVARQRAIQRDLNAKETYRAEVALRDGAQSATAKTVGLEVERLLEQWTAIRAQVRATSPAYAALQQPQTIDVKQLQASLLDANTAMVSYHLGEAHSYVWVIDRQSIAVERLPAMATIDAVARRYHEALSREVDSLSAAEKITVGAAAKAAGRELAAMVWKPVETRLKGKRLLIVADRGLHYVPFAALPTSSGLPVIAGHEVVNLPSASVLATLRNDSRRVSLDAGTAVFADPVFSKSDPRLANARDAQAPSKSRADDGGVYGRLRFSRREAEAIGERAPGAFQALDFSATKASVTSRNLRQYRVLHFATHGSLNTEHPELSGLVFSLVDKNGKTIDGFLRLHEIYNLDLEADLVVLSACRTALGREVHGEGLIGLTRGFMYAGASRVVSSVWNVDDRASALLMSRFYDAMRTKKLAPAAALRDAQLSLMNDPRWSNPHYWAAFGLQGEWK